MEKCEEELQEIARVTLENNPAPDHDDEERAECSEPALKKRCKEGHRRPNGRWEARHRPKSSVPLDHSNPELAQAYRGVDIRTGLHKYEWLQYFDSKAEKDAFIRDKRDLFKAAKKKAVASLHHTEKETVVRIETSHSKQSTQKPQIKTNNFSKNGRGINYEQALRTSSVKSFSFPFVNVVPPHYTAPYAGTASRGRTNISSSSVGITGGNNMYYHPFEPHLQQHWDHLQSSQIERFRAFPSDSPIYLDRSAQLQPNHPRPPMIEMPTHQFQQQFFLPREPSHNMNVNSATFKQWSLLPQQHQPVAYARKTTAEEEKPKLGVAEILTQMRWGTTNNSSSIQSYN
eukprot:CAMPEP_0197306350 /NCGR_PEP_ID=MMETSP0891-20130614/3101_1 /TAXON_ID=44058 ORGANISM="Aureoumbra lagunensis, Strain CCMP1510" /NCGR_SAMPLE_ID=MMETSP0891 /ASSEMBLY_ACC=CAM_ASM_000534 /LENGTH=343 /DNA_ID=CAMNT_0042788455 /DNA_START=54 /DNA_END=1085 /DNA_ORIENTATION=-